jgi:hypothetical protein
MYPTITYTMVSGKTVLASLVVEEARKLESSPTVSFFYFKQEDSDRNNFLSMARTLLSQILEQSPHTLDYFYSKCCSSGGAVLTSRALVEELLRFALSNCESAYIVLDGLDECCTRKERGEIASWFRDLIENGPPDIRDRLHCLFISQHDSARKDYRDLPSITADADNNEEDIEAFCKVQSGKLVTKLDITEEYAHEIAERVSAAAEGMSALNIRLASLTTMAFKEYSFSLISFGLIFAARAPYTAWNVRWRLLQLIWTSWTRCK